MLRRFNAFIKGSRVRPEASTTRDQILRPTQSSTAVESTSSASALSHIHLSIAETLPQLAMRAREDFIAPSEHSEDGHLHVSSNPNALYTATGHRQGETTRNSSGGLVPPEPSRKEDYEYSNHLNSLELPSSPRKEFQSDGNALDFHTIDLRDSSSKSVDVSGQPSTQDGEESAEVADVRSAEKDSYSLAILAPQIQPGPTGFLSTNKNVADSHGDMAIGIPDAETTGGIVDMENLRKGSSEAIGPPRTISVLSIEADYCRICQQHTEEQLIDLGCLCRGDLAKAHKSCIEIWFKNKGTNKCEVCQRVASNIAAPASDPMPHFWVWRVGGPYAAGQGYSSRGGLHAVGIYSGPNVTQPVILVIIQRHPFIPIMWVLLLAFMTYLFVDAINTSTIGYAAMPIGFLFGVLVVLGLGTAVRLILECCHERNLRRNRRRMELPAIPENPIQVVDPPATQQTPPPEHVFEAVV